MADIFGYKRSPKPDGVFSTEDSSLIIGDANTVSRPYLVQNWSIDYNQDVQELFELGSNRLYWVKGRPVGRGMLGRVVGGESSGYTSGLFPKDAYDICDGGATVMIKAVGGHCKGGRNVRYTLDKGVTLVLQGVVVSTIGYSMSVQDVRIYENYGWRFAYLEIK